MFDVGFGDVNVIFEDLKVGFEVLLFGMGMVFLFLLFGFIGLLIFGFLDF